MQIAQLGNQALHHATQLAPRQEKTATLALLEHLAEVERRRLFAELAYSSLWEYVRKALGYSEAQTSERVGALRLMKAVPEVKTGLANGSLSLTSAAKLASHARRENLEPLQTAALLGEVAGKSSRELERFLITQSQAISTTQDRSSANDLSFGNDKAAPAALLTRRHARTRAISPQLTRISFDGDEEFMALVARAQELGGHSGSQIQDTLTIALREYVKRRLPKDKSDQVLRAPEVQAVENAPTSAYVANAVSPVSRAPSRSRSRYIPTAIKQAVRGRSLDRCEFVDPASQRRCEAKHRLEIHHVEEWSRGGTHEVANLRHFCRAHNQLEAIRSFGSDRMSEHVSSLR